MSRFTTIAKDLRGTLIYLQGARSSDTINAIAGINFQNYDDDTKITYDMADITLLDHYGGSNQNGFGDLKFSTCAGGSNNRMEVMRMLHNGKIGVGTSNPTDRFEVSGGNLSIVGNYGIIFKNPDGTIVGSIQNSNGQMVSYSNTEAFAGGQQSSNNSNVTQLQSLANVPILRTEVVSTDWITVAKYTHSPAIYGTVTQITVNAQLFRVPYSNQTYALRIMDPNTATIYATLASLSNYTPSNISIPITFTTCNLEVHTQLSSRSNNAVCIDNITAFTTLH
jgi:hypothetical protein